MPDLTSTVATVVVTLINTVLTQNSCRKTPAPALRVPTIKPCYFLHSGHEHITTQPSTTIIEQPSPKVPHLTPIHATTLPRVPVDILEDTPKDAPVQNTPTLIPVPSPSAKRTPLRKYKLRRQDLNKLLVHF